MHLHVHSLTVCYTDLWDSTPPLPVVRHVCARLTDLSSNQTSFRLHLTPFPREQPPQWRSPGNHPLISEVSVCIIVFTLSSDTQSLAYSHTLLHGHTHAPTVTYSNVLLNIFEKAFDSFCCQNSCSSLIYYVFFICIHKHSLYCCQKVVLKCVAQADLENHLCSPAKVNICLICYRLYSVKTKQREENSQTQRIMYMKHTRTNMLSMYIWNNHMPLDTIHTNCICRSEKCKMTDEDSHLTDGDITHIHIERGRKKERERERERVRKTNLWNT